LERTVPLVQTAQFCQKSAYPTSVRLDGKKSEALHNKHGDAGSEHCDSQAAEKCSLGMLPPRLKPALIWARKCGTEAPLSA
jgi:hypothetical protein